MDVLLHFGATRLDLRMRRLVSGKDELGIKYAGEVLTGQKGVREAIQLEGLRAAEEAVERGSHHRATPAEVAEGVLRRVRGE